MATFTMSNEEIASWFITSTCQLLPKSFPSVSDSMHNLLIETVPVPTSYWMLCGSAAEFYIRPLQICIDDTDAFISQVDEMAFIDDFPVLPSDMSGLVETITCYMIESYHEYPGFVRLRILGDLNYDWKYKKYESNCRPTASTGLYRLIPMARIANSHFAQVPFLFHSSTHIVSGPSIKGGKGSNCLGSDNVKSIFCPQWPTEARNWTARPRKHGWPSTCVVSEVVQNGCHVVYVQHRLCKDDQLQWRLSFSISEVILLQSWTPVQQIVYHMLRFFAKRELMSKDNHCPKEDEILCSYHLKTLMLWTCEEMPSEWWDSSCVIVICCELMTKLLEWLKRINCPNYFIPEANLFHAPSSSTMLQQTERRISEFCNTEKLCHWFIENYILSIISINFKFERPPVIAPDLSQFLLHLLGVRKSLILESLDNFFSLTFLNSHKIFRLINKHRPRLGLRFGLQPVHDVLNSRQEGQRIYGVIPTLENVLSFKYFENLLLLLHSTNSFSLGKVSLDSELFVELINKVSMQPKTVRSQHHNFPKTFAIQSGRFQLLSALDLMRNLTGSNARSEFQLVSLMSKVFLRKALKCDDSRIDGIAPATLAYLAALYFATSEYHQAIRCCFGVLGDQTSKDDKETLNAGCLLFTDDIARIIGFIVLHKKITEHNIQYIDRRLYLDLRLSPKVFAQYIAALSGVRTAKHIEHTDDLPDSPFPMDKYLKILFRPMCISAIKSGSHLNSAKQIAYCRTDSITETEAADHYNYRSTPVNSLTVQETVIDILMEYAIENMTSFYDVIRKDFNIQCNTAECYRAVYLYKCRQYDEVMNLCERILHERDLQGDMKDFAFVNVLMVPPIESLFDADVRSLLGFQTLFFYLSPNSGDLKKYDIDSFGPPEPSYLHCFDKSCERYVTVEGIRVRLGRRCIERRYFVGRHFLARYLKVRCCIDCNLPHREALIEIAAMKIHRPFEHIMRRFLQHKFCVDIE